MGRQAWGRDREEMKETAVADVSKPEPLCVNRDVYKDHVLPANIVAN